MAAVAWQWSGASYESATAIPLSDLGFRVGWSAFESLALRDGDPQFLTEHLALLRVSCAALRIPVPDAALDEQAIRETWLGQTGFARIYVTVGDGFAATARVFLIVEERPPFSAADYARGWRLDQQSTPHSPAFGGLKCGAYAQNVLALHIARSERGLDETLLFNDRDELISSAVANVFVVRGGEVYTPHEAQGARRGVARAWVCEQRDVKIEAISREEVGLAEEVFLTNSWIGVMPIRECAGRPLAMSTGLALAVDWQSEPFA